MSVFKNDDLFTLAERRAVPATADIPQEVMTLFEKLALEISAQGYTRYSADAVLHRIRWHYQIDRGNREFKANDHWTAPLARWFLKRHPELPGFFETRRSPHSGEDA